MMKKQAKKLCNESELSEISIRKGRLDKWRKSEEDSSDNLIDSVYVSATK